MKAPVWATHKFLNTANEVVWFNPKTGAAQLDSTGCQLVLTRKSHYGYSTCVAL